MSRAANPFIALIKSGKISTPAQLRTAYRRLLMKSHPDAVGSDRLLDLHLSFSASYEEARHALASQEPAGSREPAARGHQEPPTPNHRLAYYQALQELERIDKPYVFHRDRNLRLISELKRRAWSHAAQWGALDLSLYAEADRDYDRLKTEKPTGPYMKNALAINVSPVFHNVIAYHLTGVGFYRNQVKQNLPAVLQRLADHGCHALKAFLEQLIDDMTRGPALFGDDITAGRKRLPAS